MAYTVQFSPVALRQFSKLARRAQQDVQTAIDEVEINPRPHGVVKLKGQAHLYRVRVGDYRVLYEIDDKARLVLVTRIAHRREAYRV